MEISSTARVLQERNILQQNKRGPPLAQKPNNIVNELPVVNCQTAGALPVQATVRLAREAGCEYVKIWHVFGVDC